MDAWLLLTSFGVGSPAENLIRESTHKRIRDMCILFNTIKNVNRAGILGLITQFDLFVFGGLRDGVDSSLIIRESLKTLEF